MKIFLDKLKYRFYIRWFLLKEILKKYYFRKKEIIVKWKVWDVKLNENRESGNMWINLNKYYLYKKL